MYGISITYAVASLLLLGGFAYITFKMTSKKQIFNLEDNNVSIVLNQAVGDKSRTVECKSKVINSLDNKKLIYYVKTLEPKTNLIIIIKKINLLYLL